MTPPQPPGGGLPWGQSPRLRRLRRAIGYQLTPRWSPAKVRLELAEGLRSFPVGNYVLFYLPAGDGIELVRALSGYRDISADDFEA